MLRCFYLLFLAGIVIIQPAAVNANAAPAKPNILLMLADDMGYSDIGCYGSEIATPHLDALAANGLRFSQFYNTGRCCPSRASLLTGLYAHQAGVGHMLGRTGFPGYQENLRPDNVTIPELLKSAGYATFMCGKWHIGWADNSSPNARGFDQFYGARGYIDSYYTVVPQTDVYLNDRIVNPALQPPVNHLHPDQEWYTTDVFTDYALHFLNDHFAKTNRAPFFLYLAYNAPHWPLHAKPADLAKYRGKYKNVGWNQLRPQRLKRLVESGLINAKWALSECDAPDWDSLSDDVKDELDLKMALYAAMIDCLDQNVGRVIAKLKASGQFDNTLIVFLSDNGGNHEGGMFGYQGHKANAQNYDRWAKAGGRSSSCGQGWANVSNTPFRRYKRENHEGGISAPFIVHWPAGGVKPGLTPQVAHLIDFMPTFAELAGATYPKERAGNPVPPMEGKSLASVFQGSSLGPRTLFWEHEGNRAVRLGDWKLAALNGKPWEFYDMSRDRTETTDLADKNPAKASELRAEWDRWAARANVLPWETVTAKMKAQQKQSRTAKEELP
jgi:arylsulfatase